MARSPKQQEGGQHQVARNSKAFARYAIDDRFESGIMLRGSEVKSLRAGHADLDAAYVRIAGGQAYVINMYIGPYKQAGQRGHEERSERKLLLHRREIDKLEGKLSTKGYALVPLRLYFTKGKAKLELGLGKGKKKGDERESIKRELDLREARDAMRRSGR